MKLRVPHYLYNNRRRKHPFGPIFRSSITPYRRGWRHHTTPYRTTRLGKLSTIMVCGTKHVKTTNISQHGRHSLILLRRKEYDVEHLKLLQLYVVDRSTATAVCNCCCCMYIHTHMDMHACIEGDAVFLHKKTVQTGLRPRLYHNTYIPHNTRCLCHRRYLLLSSTLKCLLLSTKRYL